MNKPGVLDGVVSRLIERIGRGEVPRFDELFAARTELEKQLTRLPSATRRRLAIALGKGLKRVTSTVRAVLDETIADAGAENLTDRLRAIDALSYSREVDDGLITPLIALTTEPNGEVAEAAVRTLGWLGSGRPDVADALRSLAVSGPVELRAAAVYALGRLGASVQESGGWLVQLLPDADDTVREAVVFSLAQLEVTEAVAVHAVWEVVRTAATKTTREAAVAALGVMAVGDEATAKRLAALIRHAEAPTRKRCVRTLERIGIRHPVVLRAIYSVLRDRQVENVLVAVRAVAVLGRGDERALVELTRLAQARPTDDDPIGRDARRVIRELQTTVTALIDECVERWDLPTRDEVLRRLTRAVRHDHDTALTELVVRLGQTTPDDPARERLQLMVCAVARELGETAGEVAPLLNAWLEGRPEASRAVADQAELALRAIGPGVRRSLRDDAAGGMLRPESRRTRLEVAEGGEVSAVAEPSRSFRLRLDQERNARWTRSNKNDIIMPMSTPHKNKKTAVGYSASAAGNQQDGTKTVVDLLKENRSVDEIRDYLRHCVAPSAEELVKPLNDWMREQNPDSFAGKHRLAEFMKQILSVCGVVSCYDQTSFYFKVAANEQGYPDGRIFAFPHRGTKPLLSRRTFAEVPEFNLAMTRSKYQSAEASAEGDNTSRNTWVQHLATLGENPGRQQPG